MNRKYLQRKKLQSESASPAGGTIKAIFQYAAVPFTLASGLLYLIGCIYHAYYLSYWGLSDSIFPISKDDSIISGFFRVLIYSLKMLPKVTIFITFVWAVLIVLFVSTYRPLVTYLESACTRFKENAVPVLRKNIFITTAHEGMVNKLQAVTVAVGLLTLVLFVLTYACKLSIEQATNNAKQEHQRVLSGKPSSESFPSRATLLITNPSKGFDTYSGHLIQTSATHCALYDKGRGVMIFPLANVAKMVISENKAGASRAMAEKK